MNLEGRINVGRSPSCQQVHHAKLYFDLLQEETFDSPGFPRHGEGTFISASAIPQFTAGLKEGMPETGLINVSKLRMRGRGGVGEAGGGRGRAGWGWGMWGRVLVKCQENKRPCCEELIAESAALETKW